MPPKANKRKRSKKVQNGDVAENSEVAVKSKSVKKVLKGKACVDALCPIASTAHVYYEDDDIYDAMLNQTNIQFNNNKYYIIQLLEDDNKKAYSVWFRWGRVGMDGQNNLIRTGSDLNKAKQLFTKKFSDKTKNNWDERNNFEKVQGKYDLLAMDQAAEDTEDEPDSKKQKVKELEQQEEEETSIVSKLDEALQDLIQLICDIQAMEEAVVEMKYDTRKAPLGKLTKDQIKAGYEALKEIDLLISQSKNRDLLYACNQYYTRIPHYFGMKVPPVIRTHSQLKAELELLETLGDIEVAINILKSATQKDMHPIDRRYHSLECKLTTLDKNSDEFKMVSNYVVDTHASTHTSYKMSVIDVFECERVGEVEKFDNKGNVHLLWHGSRLSNWAGILYQGLRIAPPEAPVTGYMFGKGIYFADRSSKSANYCFANRSKSTGMLVLCEVSLGTPRMLVDADYEADTLPKGKHSVVGKGRVIPDPKGNKTLSNGTIVPMGKSINNTEKGAKNFTLNYNEYVVYNTNQVRMKYLVKTKFIYK